jgi:hypothetical protein
MPVESIAGGEVVRVDRACMADGRLGEGRLAIVEWDAAVPVYPLLEGRLHALVFDPPYRAEHLLVVRELHRCGASAHLLYGEVERKEAAALLQYLVHPRFAMVCVYRAMESASRGTGEVLEKARGIAWQEAGVTLTDSDLARAQTVLLELGLERWSAGKAKLDARQSAAYLEAEAEYEECVRLCLSL